MTDVVFGSIEALVYKATYIYIRPLGLGFLIFVLREQISRIRLRQLLAID